MKEHSGNLIMSPLSADIVLAMTAYGAQGETENQFRNVLHLPSSDSLAKSGYQTLIDNLNVRINLFIFIIIFYFYLSLFIIILFILFFIHILI